MIQTSAWQRLCVCSPGVTGSCLVTSVACTMEPRKIRKLKVFLTGFRPVSDQFQTLCPDASEPFSFFSYLFFLKVPFFFWFILAFFSGLFLSFLVFSFLFFSFLFFSFLFFSFLFFSFLFFSFHYFFCFFSLVCCNFLVLFYFFSCLCFSFPFLSCVFFLFVSSCFFSFSLFVFFSCCFFVSSWAVWPNSWYLKHWFI